MAPTRRNAIASACSTWWPASFKLKHVEGLEERWRAEGLTVGTIKNWMAELRLWAEKIGK